MEGRGQGPQNQFQYPFSALEASNSRCLTSIVTLESRIDVHPGESELLDIAARFDNNLEWYGCNNEAYFL
jgi:hypothetical protein